MGLSSRRLALGATLALIGPLAGLLVVLPDGPPIGLLDGLLGRVVAVEPARESTGEPSAGPAPEPAGEPARELAGEPDLTRFGPSARRVHLTYAVRLHDLPPHARRVEAWIPLPRDHAYQALESYALLEGYPAAEVEEAAHGNHFLRLTLTSAAAKSAHGSPLPITLEATVIRRAYSAWRLPGPPHPSPQAMTRYLAPNRLVPTGGFIADEARRVVGDAAGPLGKARRLYDHVVGTLSYDKSGEGWGRGDAVYACDVRTGNCTDFHSLFIAEARAVGVPARFLIGAPLPSGTTEGTIGGYHCWSEFWLDGHGWVPVDASEAHKRPELRDLFFGSLDAHRVELTVGRDLDLPGAAVEDLNFVIYPHVEVDGAVHQAVETELRFREASSSS